MKFSTLIVAPALLAQGVFAAWNCKNGLNYCGPSIYAKNEHQKINGWSTQANVLYGCRDDSNTLIKVKTCHAGCIEADDGVSDYCAADRGFTMTPVATTCVEVTEKVLGDNMKYVKNELSRLRVNYNFLRQMYTCLLPLREVNEGTTGQAAFEKTEKEYRETLVKLEAEIEELAKEQES